MTDQLINHLLVPVACDFCCESEASLSVKLLSRPGHRGSLMLSQRQLGQTKNLLEGPNIVGKSPDLFMYLFLFFLLSQAPAASLRQQRRTREAAHACNARRQLHAS